MAINILTGLQATGKVHIGNYLGAIKPMVERQKQLTSEDKMYFFVPDLHSFTTPIEHTTLYSRVIENIKIYLASGIDPNHPNTIIYRQSHISAHSELSWILSCFSYFGEMQKMTQFKDKSRNKGESVSVGLFTYPILMAADILLYNALYIPLGDDQKQHLELTRDLATRINNKFEKEIFTVPKPWNDQMKFLNLEKGVRIRSLQNPESKMSKSVEDPKGTILLEDEPMQAAKKIMSAVTDDFADINWNWETQPGVTNLLQIYQLLSGEPLENIKQTWTGITRYGDLKKTVALEMELFLNSFQQKLKSISDEDVEQITTKGEERAAKVATQTLNKIQKEIGLIR